MNTTHVSTNLLISATLRIRLGILFIALIILLPIGRWNHWQRWMYLCT